MMKVFVYRNLHRKMWSIQSREGKTRGRIIGYAKALGLNDAKTKVDQKGRQRVIKDRVKNVHAGILGDLIAVFDFKERREKPFEMWGILDLSLEDCKRHFGEGSIFAKDPNFLVVEYDPYKMENFRFKESGLTAHGAKTARFFEDGKTVEFSVD